MRFSSLLPVPFCVILTLAFARGGFAQNSAEALTQLENAAREELSQKQSRPEAEKSGDERLERGAVTLFQLRPALARSEGADLDAVLNQIQTSFHSEKVRQSVEKLRGALRAEREVKEKELAEETEAILARASQAVQSARATTDLDNAIRELSLVQERRDATSEKTRVLVEHARNARQFLVYWQDYLDYMAAGRPAQAKAALQSANSIVVANILPRSAILARLAEFKDEKEESEKSPVPALREIMAKTKSLADLSAAIEAVGEVRRSSKKPDGWDSPAFILYNELTSLRRSYDDFRAGLPTILPFKPALTQAPIVTEMTQLALPLRVELARLVIPRFLRVDQALRNDETIDDYVDRMMQLAFERGDPRLIMRVYELRHAISGNSQSLQLSPGMDALLAARNQEDAGQFVPAVVSYQRALRIGGELVPAKAIGARLDAIKTSHPAEYESGMKVYLAKPDPTPPTTVGILGGTLKVPGSDSTQPPPGPSPIASPQ